MKLFIKCQRENRRQSALPRINGAPSIDKTIPRIAYCQAGTWLPMPRWLFLGIRDRIFCQEGVSSRLNGFLILLLVSWLHHKTKLPRCTVREGCDWASMRLSIAQQNRRMNQRDSNLAWERIVFYETSRISIDGCVSIAVVEYQFLLSIIDLPYMACCGVLAVQQHTVS